MKSGVVTMENLSSKLGDFRRQQRVLEPLKYFEKSLLEH